MLIRHADAGDRGGWAGDDALRPLSAIGRDQAMHLVGLWREQPLERVLSSPYVRCVESVEPLASALGLDVEEVDALAEGSATEAQRLVQSLVATDAALCTHGDIIPAVLQHLESSGVRIVNQWKWSKSSTWVLHADDGQFTHATYVPRPL